VHASNINLELHGGRRGGRSTSALGRGAFDNSRSYGDESSIFGAAGLESSIASPSEFGGIPDSTPAPIRSSGRSKRERERMVVEEKERLDREKSLRDHARTPVDRARSPVDRAREQAMAFSESWSQKRSRYSDNVLDCVASIAVFLRR